MSTLAVQSDEAEQRFMEAMTVSAEDDLYGAYRRLREAAPALMTGDGTLVLSDFAECSAALRHRALGKGEELLGMQSAKVADDIREAVTERLGRSMIMLNPPEHTRLRKQVSDQFTPRHIQALRALIEQRVDVLLDALAAGGGGDFVTDLALPLPLQVIADLLGIPEDDHALIFPIAKDAAELTSPDAPAETIAEIIANGARMSSYLSELLTRKRGEPQDDLLSRLVLASNRLTESETIGTALLLFGAGFETTVNLLGNGLSALLAHPGQMDLLRADPTLIPAAVEEFLRYDAPIQIDARSVLEPATLHGIDLTQGTMVITILGSANHDPARFDHPDEFDITRTDTEHLAFAAGPHFCLGAHLARLEAQVVFERLLNRFTTITAGATPTRRPGIFLRGYNSLPITLTH